jgi:hypothetical protein
MILQLKAWLFMAFIYTVASTAHAYTDDDLGYSIDIDNGYQVNRMYGTTMFESNDSDNVVIIKNWPGLTRDMAGEYLVNGYQNETMAIVATGDIEQQKVENGSGLLVDVLGIFERKLRRGLAAGFIGDNGQGMVVLVSAPDEDWDAFESEAKKIAASVRFIEPLAGPDAHDWYLMLAGTRLSLRFASNDERRREDLYFCSDGSFVHRLSTSAMKDSESGAAFGFSTETGSGSWKVVDGDGDSRLMLLYSDGGEESAIIEDRDGRAYLDGRRYTIMRNNRCR